MLTRLGYRILRPEDFALALEAEPGLVPDLLLVDERELPEVTTEEDPYGRPVPIILLCSRQGATGADTRIIGAVKRPAGLHDLYRLMQQVFEDTPRTTPRVATQLRARCESRGEHWEGRVLSLSENGCLIRTSEVIRLGEKVRLELVLTQNDPIEVEAEAAYQLLPDIGLVFHAVEPSSREKLGRFVADTILCP
jgi:PilZ domain